ncbi:response regulator [Aeoliella sp. ICT_H6.2]|uniref:Response regulator n=1 Tax=Aeoliella straminimaris TaxID=2954799 RepID=A0A9X2FJW7_9BACT|nr:response regulator [Aeoliella straminimaris]MCO6047986.1 response regulator [Aeoliella straminimaris]
MAHLLIVDDDLGVSWSLAKLAERMGLAADTVSTAEEAFVRLQDGSPDLVLLDIRLPKMDGLTAMRTIHRLSGDVPIIVMSAFNDLTTIKTAYRRGAAAFLKKPFTMEEVRSLILRTLCHHPIDEQETVPPPHQRA